MSLNYIREYSMTSTEICDEIIELFKKHDRAGNTRPGEISRGVDKDTKDSTDLVLGAIFDKDPYAEALANRYMEVVKKCTMEYCDHYKLPIRGVNPKTTPQIQYYKPKGGYKEWHSDATFTGNQSRCLVYITYLNDVPNGGTMFRDWKYTSKSAKGNTVIFPPFFTHVHKGQISKKHEKYIITGWLHYTD
tara:strand:- start:46 stop:615 length:570 start_codon:yes stop_codon:yes gene_type:complete